MPTPFDPNGRRRFRPESGLSPFPAHSYPWNRDCPHWDCASDGIRDCPFPFARRLIDCSHAGWRGCGTPPTGCPSVGTDSRLSDSAGAAQQSEVVADVVVLEVGNSGGAESGLSPFLPLLVPTEDGIHKGRPYACRATSRFRVARSRSEVFLRNRLRRFPRIASDRNQDCPHSRRIPTPGIGTVPIGTARKSGGPESAGRNRDCPHSYRRGGIGTVPIPTPFGPAFDGHHIDAVIRSFRFRGEGRGNRGYRNGDSPHWDCARSGSEARTAGIEGTGVGGRRNSGRRNSGLSLSFRGAVPFLSTPFLSPGG